MGVVREATRLHAKIRKDFKRNDGDVKQYKHKMDHCLLRLRECETNIEELKHLNVDDERKYERIIKKNLLIGLTNKVRSLVRGLNDIKNINTGGVSTSIGSKSMSGGGAKGGLFAGLDEEDQSEFNFLSQVRHTSP